MSLMVGWLKKQQQFSFAYELLLPMQVPRVAALSAALQPGSLQYELTAP